MAIAKCSRALVLRLILDPTEIAGFRFRHSVNKLIQSSAAQSSSIDVLDNFTDKLVQEKSTKWKTRSAVLKGKCSSTGTRENRTHISAGYIDYLESFLSKAIQSKRSEYASSLLDACQQRNEYPSPKLLLQAASFFGRTGNQRGLEIVQQVCESIDKEEFNNQAQYKHYIAEATWKNGNIEEALNIFSDVYHNHNSLRRKIRAMTKFLFSECILHKSEASLVLIKRFAHTLAEKYGDFFFLSCLWQYCFLSEWFSDQQFAIELLNENEKLKQGIQERAPYLALEALKTHQVNVVQRILEVLLLFDMKLQYTQVLRALFDYKCYQGDVRGCFAILKSALQFNISLNIGEQMQFLFLLASDEERMMLRELSKHYKHCTIVVPQFNLKF